MKKFLTCVMLAMFSAAVVGCSASAEVDDDEMDSDSSYKKTTKVDRDGGDYKKTTEVKRD
ncbi:MAG: hypothetical protein M3478_06995 [Planctomycetota bacterium]|nr:hypothetical protein [Planctomycetota bacterium]